MRRQLQRERTRGSVLIVAPGPLERPGGVERAMSGLRDALRAAGYEVEVLPCVEFEPTWLPRGGSLEKKLRHIAGAYRAGRAARTRASNGLTAVVSNGDLGFAVGIPPGRNVKLIHFYHGTYRGQAEAIRPFISRLGYFYLKWWHSMVLERAGARGKLLLSNSEQTAEEVRRYFGRSSITLWLPLDTQVFRPGDQKAARVRLGVVAEQPIGLFVGSTAPMKNFPMVWALVEALPQVRWLMALRGDVPAEVAEHPRISVYRDAGKDLLPLLYSAADFSICPSLYEPFGYVVAEALACGTPVIATPGGASRLLMCGAPLERLLVANPHSLNQFLSAVTELLRAPETYRAAVLERARPEIERWMAADGWARRFCEAAGL